MRGKPALKGTLAGRIGVVVLTLVLLGSTAIAFADEKCGPKPCKRSLKAYPMRFVVIGDRTGGHVPGVFGTCRESLARSCRR